VVSLLGAGHYEEIEYEKVEFLGNRKSLGMKGLRISYSVGRQERTGRINKLPDLSAWLTNTPVKICVRVFVILLLPSSRDSNTGVSVII